jgi:hypothetical protein
MTWQETSPFTKCPHCGTSTPLATSTQDNGAPRPGDFTMCIACGRWGTFTADLTLRKPTSEELGELGRNGYAVRAHLAWLLRSHPKETTP